MANLTTLEKLQSHFPSNLYDVYNTESILYGLLKVYADRFDARRAIAVRLYAMIGIEDTYDEDLEHRWGALLNIYRKVDESYDDYRARLMIIYSALSGGTAEAIKYAVATTIGISSDRDLINEYIHVYDAWNYPGNDIRRHDDDHVYNALTNNENKLLNDTFILNEEYNIRSYGAFVVTIDLSIQEAISTTERQIMLTINQAKASGTNPYLVFLYITNEVADLTLDEWYETFVTDIKSELKSISVSEQLLTNIIHNHTEDEDVRLLEYVFDEINQDDDNEIADSEIDDVLYDIVNYPIIDNVSLISTTNSFLPITNDENILLNNDFILNNPHDTVDVDVLLDDIKDIYSDNTNIDEDAESELLSITQLPINESAIQDNIDILIDKLLVLADDTLLIASTTNMFTPLTNDDSKLLNGDFVLNDPIGNGDSGDKLFDDIHITISDVGQMQHVSTNMLSVNGTNSIYAMLNDSLILNRSADVDECVDIITYN